MIRNFLADEQGATLVEYALICVLLVGFSLVVTVVGSLLLIAIKL